MAIIQTALIVCSTPSTAQVLDKLESNITYKVGMDSRSIIPPGSYEWRGAETHALITTIWYPANQSAAEHKQWIGPPSQHFAEAGKAAPDAALVSRPKRFPMIVLSHGTGGSALMMAWLGTRLAASGYIVVAVNHPGNNALEKYTVQGFSFWWDRAEDLSATITSMLSDPVFGPRINKNKIGAGGFSIGGNTVITLAGGIANPRALERFCSSPNADQTCDSPPEFPSLKKKIKALEKSSSTFVTQLLGAEKSHQDSRVKAVFAIAPALGKAFIPSTLEQISIPVEIVAGESDEIMPLKNNAKLLAQHISTSRLVLLPQVGHYTFLAVCTEIWQEKQHKLCTDRPKINRNEVHKKVARRAIRFFDAVFGVSKQKY